MTHMTKLRSLFAIAAFLPLTDFASSEVHDVFANPPPEARLQMWYHWIGDCITEEGIVADLKAMGELGVSTAHIFAPSMADLPVKAKPMDAEWMRLFGVAIREAKRNGLTFTWTCWDEAFSPDYPLRESGLLGPVRLFY